MPPASETLERVFREEYGRMIATLIRLSGSFDLAEESLQEAFASAEGYKNLKTYLARVAERPAVRTVYKEEGLLE